MIVEKSVPRVMEQIVKVRRKDEKERKEQLVHVLVPHIREAPERSSVRWRRSSRQLQGLHVPRSCEGGLAEMES